MVAKRAAKKKPAVKQDERGKMNLLLTAVVLYGIMLLLGYLTVATPQSGTAMGAIQTALLGLGGSLAIVPPIFFGWLATLTLLRALGRPLSPMKCIGDGALFPLLHTAVQLFVTEEIIARHMAIRVFSNYIAQSCRYMGGGGAIGAVLAWPLYNLLGKWGGLIIVLLLVCLLMTASGRMRKLAEALRGGVADAQQRSMDRRNRREAQEPQMEERYVSASRTRAMDPESDLPAMRANRRVQSPSARRNALENPGRSNVDPYDTPGLKATEAPRRPRRQRMAAVDAPSIMDTPLPKKKRPAPMAQENSPFDIPIDPKLENKEEPIAQSEPIDIDFPELISEKPPEPVKEVPKKAPKAEKVELAQEDLTIEPERSEVFEADIEEKPAAQKKEMPKLKRTPYHAEQPEEEPYNYPPIDLLTEGERVQENHRDSDMEKAALLEDTLKQFGIATKLCGIAHGPAVTRFELQPAPGVKVSRITSLSDDIAMHLAAMSVRIEAPIPGKAAVGVEIPNDKIEMVRLRDVLESQEARKSASRIAVGLGKDNSGRYIVADIAKMPHVLIAGQTGSGKSVCINSIISSILFRATPEEVRLILIDPKVVELSIYNDIPHLVCPVVTDCKKAASALDWAVAEMSRRYKQFAERGVRDIKGYNKALKEGEKIMPQMVIIIDELADLMMVAPGEVEDSICRLAQLARAAGMHLVIATQRPSVNVITGIIKANIPTRIAFSVASQVDSRTMIDHGGAEKLLGNGDMLFVPSGINKPMRVQGAWVSDEEVHAIVSYIKERSDTTYDQDMIEQMDNATRSDAEKEEFSSEYDPRLPEAVEIVVEAGQASVSMLQRRMRVGYARAGRLIDEMEQRGIVSEAEGAKPRTVLISREELSQLFEDAESA